MSTFKVGEVVSGKIAGIQSYGAFVALDNSTQGLVHISEITHGFVKDIHDFLEVGQEVKVKILDIDEEKNKISLSIRATEEAPKEQPAKKKNVSSGEYDEGFNTLRDKLEEWIKKADK
ncbi:S1 domain-containing post-transcriptional regulator GSP13 [Listeria innocua]|uniref:Lin2468 protein n=1 Tax=Listeria innocua serovar 6a (strain ATCC BAA-680 / CLIP 11262) TaxID=272626 RepID=Q928R4_LISIN|nr:S1 domain-containing post-transcriptional regulator GSP13 [Listeria innocua]EEQ0537625.1 general stress protein 13 [Listeria innocua]EIF5872499.1 general stress protein 13 [Listeria innocua]EKG5243155.1 general stress protein 13 [Listeria innocua]EKG5261559.1 general stress protein 13 [Listeria innocua]CAC97695.1 lin2468 [Listeria innocua Clip11262]